jgi:hypothetical protein
VKVDPSWFWSTHEVGSGQKAGAEFSKKKVHPADHTYVAGEEIYGIVAEVPGGLVASTS